MLNVDRDNLNREYLFNTISKWLLDITQISDEITHKDIFVHLNDSKIKELFELYKE